MLREVAGSIEANAKRGAFEFSGTTRHQPLRRLGEGSFGVVYEAYDETLGRHVAIKVLRIHTAEALFRFKREFRQTRDLQHPNLVRLHELYQTDGSWVLVMELVEGEPLLRFLAKKPGALASAFSQLAAGLCALHEAGRVHRDVKPDNVLVEANGRVVLVDFGMAMDTEGSTAAGGTPQYAAPEQWLGSKPTAASDWYAFGSVLFEALHGKRPFAGEGGALFERKAQGLPQTPHTLHPLPELDELARALLAHDPSLRPTGGAVLARLPDVASGAAAAGAVVTNAPAQLVGRSAELELLAESYAARRGVVWLQGLSGIGKTALVEHWLAQLPDRALVLRGQCYDTETIRFKALDGAVDDLVSFLCRLPEVEAAALAPRDPGAAADVFPVLRRASVFARAPLAPQEPAARMVAAIEAVRELFARCSDLGPMVVFLDDVHAIDADGARLLQMLTLGHDAPKVLLVLTVRDDLAGQLAPIKTQLQSLGARFVRLDLGPLESVACVELARILADAELSHEEELAVVHESLGIPVFVRELVENRAEVVGPLKLQDALAARMSRLSQAAQRILRVLAVAGMPLSEAACRSLDELRIGAIDELLRADLVRSTGASPRRFILRHDRIRAAVLDRTTGADRVSAHAELAGLLEVFEPEDIGSVALHYRLSGNLGEALAATQAAALDAERSLAYSAAAGLWGVAAGIVQDSSERACLLERQAAMLEAAGAPGHAARALLEAANLTLNDALRIRAARQLLLNGDIERGLAAIAPTLEAFSVSVPAAGAAGLAISINHGAHLLAHDFAFTARSSVDPGSFECQRLDLLLTLSWSLSFHDLRALPFSALALRFALELGDLARAQQAAALYVFNHAPPMAEFPSVQGAFALSARLNQQLGAGADPWHRLATGALQLFRANHTEAVVAFRAAEQGWGGEPRQISVARACRVMTAVAHLHEVREILQLLPLWQREAELRGDRFLSGTLDVFGVPFLLAADRWYECDAHLARAEALAPPDEASVFIPIVQLIRFQVDLYVSRPDLADRLHGLRAALENHPVLLSPFLAGLFHSLCVAAVLSGSGVDLALADQHLEALANVPQVAGPRRGGLQAQLLARQGKSRAAMNAWLHYIEELEAQDSPVFLAHARFQLDLLRHGDGASGRQAYRELKDLGVVDPMRHGASLFGGSGDVGS